MNYYIVPSFLANFYKMKVVIIFYLCYLKQKINLTCLTLASYLLTELDISSYNYFKF